MGEIQSAKPAVSRVASRDPVSSTAQPPKPSAPSQPSRPSLPSVPSQPSSRRPILPIALFVVILAVAVGGLFVYRFVLKKTILTPFISHSPSPAASGVPAAAASVVSQNGNTSEHIIVGKVVSVETGKDESKVVISQESTGKKFTVIIKDASVFVFKRSHPDEKLTVEMRVELIEFKVGDKAEVVTNEDTGKTSDIKTAIKVGLI